MNRNLILKTALLISVWLVLYFVETMITTPVIVVTTTAIFGPVALPSGRGRTERRD